MQCTQSEQKQIVRVQKTQKSGGKMHLIRAKTGSQGAENAEKWWKNAPNQGEDR